MILPYSTVILRTTVSIVGVLVWLWRVWRVKHMNGQEEDSITLQVTVGKAKGSRRQLTTSGSTWPPSSCEGNQPTQSHSEWRGCRVNQTVSKESQEQQKNSMIICEEGC